MTRFSTVALNGLMIGVCALVSPLAITAIAPTAQAVPVTTGKPGRLEPGGRRALQPTPPAPSALI